MSPEQSGIYASVMSKRWIALVLLLAGIAAAVSGGAIGWHSHRSTKFDPVSWRGPVDWCTSSPRGAMVGDLVHNRLRRGMRMRRVRNMLGPPDANPDGTWLYNVDYESDGLLGTCVTLVLDAKAGRLDRWLIGRDD